MRCECKKCPVKLRLATKLDGSLILRRFYHMPCSLQFGHGDPFDANFGNEQMSSPLKIATRRLGSFTFPQRSLSPGVSFDTNHRWLRFASDQPMRSPNATPPWNTSLAHSGAVSQPGNEVPEAVFRCSPEGGLQKEKPRMWRRMAARRGVRIKRSDLHIDARAKRHRANPLAPSGYRKNVH
jgi:hypothetical protein